jgi:hypothetical protein
MVWLTRIDYYYKHTVGRGYSYSSLWGDSRVGAAVMGPSAAAEAPAGIIKYTFGRR